MVLVRDKQADLELMAESVGMGMEHRYASVVAHESGDVTVTPSEGSAPIALRAIAAELRARGVRAPLVAHFVDVAVSRAAELSACFEAAQGTYGYGGRYRGVFPVKSNHSPPLLRALAEEMGGLEVGSKPELLVGAAILAERIRAGRECGGASERPLLVCNGYKDVDYVEAALLASSLGVEVVIVLERPEELQLVLGTAARLGVDQPTLGVRARLSTPTGGHWAATGGDGGKFGLDAAELVSVCASLRRAGKLECLRLLHFHVGSQVSRIRTIKAAMREASHLYTELHAMGAKGLEYLDVGGGLAVDYDGSGRGGSDSSMDYSMQNYANDVVAALQDACSRAAAPPPTVVSESGRAIASHHSVLIFDVVGIQDTADRHIPGEVGAPSDQQPTAAASGGDSEDALAGRAGVPGGLILSTFQEVLDASGAGLAGSQETRTDAEQLLGEARAAFKLGVISLPELAQAEMMYWRCVRAAAASEETPPAREQQQLLAAKYLVNMSVFRSCVDSWAISQVFPVMPLHMLCDRPEASGTLSDITCDSDGRIQRFVGAGGEETPVLPLHSKRQLDQHGLATRPAEQGAGQHEPYLLGLFMAGVYQEDMGSLHNMFGSTAQVYVRSDPAADGPGYRIDRLEGAQTSSCTLQAMGYDASEALEAVRGAAARDDDMGRSASVLDAFAALLDSSTYLKS